MFLSCEEWIEKAIDMGRGHAITLIDDSNRDPFVLGSDDPIAYSWQGEGSLNFKK